MSFSNETFAPTVLSKNDCNFFGLFGELQFLSLLSRKTAAETPEFAQAHAFFWALPSFRPSKKCYSSKLAFFDSRNFLGKSSRKSRKLGPKKHIFCKMLLFRDFLRPSKNPKSPKPGFSSTVKIVPNTPLSPPWAFPIF